MAGHFFLFVIFLFFTVFVSDIEGKNNKFYSFPRSFCSTFSKEIDGAVLQSTRYRKSFCALRFKADDSYGKLQIQVKDLTINDCSTTLTFRDSSSTLHTFKCQDKNYSYNFKSPGRYVTVEIRNGGRGERFKIILSSLSTGYKCEFRCSRSLYCIDRDLRCDRVSHCLYGEDEHDCTWDKIGFRGSKIIGIVIGLIILLIIVIAVVFVCIRRRRAARYQGRTVVTTQAQPTTQMYPTQPVGIAVPPAAAAGTYPQYAAQQPPAGYYPPPVQGYGTGGGYMADPNQAPPVYKPPESQEMQTYPPASYQQGPYPPSDPQKTPYPPSGPQTTPYPPSGPQKTPYPPSDPLQQAPYPPQAGGVQPPPYPGAETSTPVTASVPYPPETKPTAPPP